eukprot:356825_1
MSGSVDDSSDVWKDSMNEMHTKEQLKKLKRIGGYLNIWYCIIAVIYHIFNISFAIWTFAIHELHWCPQFKITLLAIQIGSALLYLCGYYALNPWRCSCCVPKNMNIRYVDARNKLNKTNKTLNCQKNCCMIFMLSMGYIVTFGLGIAAWSETIFGSHLLKNDAKRAWFQLAFYILDLFKWTQITTIVFIIYGFLNTFEDKLTTFQTQLELKMRIANSNRNKNNVTQVDTTINKRSKHKSINISVNSAGTSTFHPENNPNPTIEFERLNHVWFIKKYFHLVDPYKYVLRIFYYFITAFGVVIVIIFLLYVWTLSIAWNTETKACTDKNVIYFFLHYVAEIVLYFGLWGILLYKLNRNHAWIEKYNTQYLYHKLCQEIQSIMVRVITMRIYCF